MRALVTGADGFIGSHLAEMLVQQGWDVRALCCYNSFGSWGWLDGSPQAASMDIRLGDVRDSHFCLSLTEGVDVVFHLASLIAIPYSYQAPESYVDTNIKGTLGLCQAARTNGVKRFIQTSTSEVYGSAQYVPIDEKHPLQPQSPYSASKIASDAMAMSFFYSFELPVTVVRPFNTYGPRQSARAVIPTIISQIADGKQRIELGDTSPTRDFNYVTDTCKGFIELAQCEAAVGETVNVGSNYEISIQDTLNLVKEIMNADVEFVQDPQRIRPAGSEVQRLWCDNSKVQALTGFTPDITLRQGLEKTIAWFSDGDNLKRYKTDIYNV